MPDPEAQGCLGSGANADPGATGHHCRRQPSESAGREHPHGATWVAYVRPVLRPADAERLAEPGGTAGQPGLGAAVCRQRAPGRGQLLACNHPARPDEHGCRLAGRLADQVHAEVHPVGEIHVRVARRPEHHRVPLGQATVGVRCRVGLPRVRLGLDDLDRHQPFVADVRQNAAEQLRGHDRSWAIEELAGHGTPVRQVRVRGADGGRRARRHASRHPEAPHAAASATTTRSAAS